MTSAHRAVNGPLDNRGTEVADLGDNGETGLTRFMIVAIDGPAGGGKSSISSRLAERLGFAFLDTGAMYRAVALAALRQGLGRDDDTAIAKLAEGLTIEFDGKRTLLDGEDVSAA